MDSTAPDPAASPHPRQSEATRADTRPLVLLVGNPNTGKTTLFNRLTGQNARIGNYPGVTVERLSGSSRLDGNVSVEVVDLPGTYSLSARSAEEQIALWAVLGQGQYPKPDLCVFVADATQLARNLYLALQLLELKLPVVIALNMIDEAAENPPNTAAVEQLFGVPCVAFSARRGTGMSALLATLERALVEKPTHGAGLRVDYPRPLLDDVETLRRALPPGGDTPPPQRS